MIPTVVIMTLIIVVLFDGFRVPIIIFAVIPFAVIGISLGLLVTRAPFGFMALLGAMSLSGMMIKNSVVLLDQINLNLAGDAPVRVGCRGRGLSSASRGQRGGNDDLWHGAAAAGRVLVFDGDHDHGRAVVRDDSDHGRGSGAVCDAV
jgi:hypothetical protein